MIQIRIDGIDRLLAKLDDAQRRQLPFAAARALTSTAKAVEARIQRDMADAFTSPSPYVKRATFATVARKSNLSAVVGLKDMKPFGGTAPAVLLKEHFLGGRRGNKPFEKAIASLGVLPSGYRAVPGSGIKLDRYGNPSRKQIGEMLNLLRKRTEVIHQRKKRKWLVGCFVIKVGARSHLAPGIYERVSRRALKPLFLFVNHAAYRKVIDMERSAREVVARDFGRFFEAAFAEAIRTAR